MRHVGRTCVATVLLAALCLGRAGPKGWSRSRCRCLSAALLDAVPACEVTGPAGLAAMPRSRSRKTATSLALPAGCVLRIEPLPDLRLLDAAPRTRSCHTSAESVRRIVCDSCAPREPSRLAALTTSRHCPRVVAVCTLPTSLALRYFQPHRLVEPALRAAFRRETSARVTDA